MTVSGSGFTVWWWSMIVQRAGLCLVVGLAIYWIGERPAMMPVEHESEKQDLPEETVSEPKPESPLPEEAIAGQIHEFEKALEQNGLEQEEARMEIERLRPMLATDPDARSALEAQESRLHELENQRHELQNELERLREKLK